MNDSFARIVRSAAQTIVGVGAAGLADWLAVDVPDTYDRYLYPGAVFLVIIAHNVIESISGFQSSPCP